MPNHNYKDVKRESFSRIFLTEVQEWAGRIDTNTVENLVDRLSALKSRNGRLFIIGMGGSAANASHASTDLRKLCNIECYSPSDNQSEITATANDFGLEHIYTKSLEFSHFNSNDSLMIFSVGGGDELRKISLSLIEAVKYAKIFKSEIFSILGRRESFIFENSDICVLLPESEKMRMTPHSESMQSIIWHLLSCHPKLQVQPTTW